MNHFILTVTGSRDYTDFRFVYWHLNYQVAAALARGLQLHVRHGGAKGVDFFTKSWCIGIGASNHLFPANWTLHGKAAGMIRNIQMIRGEEDPVVAGTAHLVLAFPFPGRTETARSGTWGCCAEAAAAGVEVVIPPYPRERK